MSFFSASWSLQQQAPPGMYAPQPPAQHAGASTALSGASGLSGGHMDAGLHHEVLNRIPASHASTTSPARKHRRAYSEGAWNFLGGAEDLGLHIPNPAVPLNARRSLQDPATDVGGGGSMDVDARAGGPPFPEALQPAAVAAATAAGGAGPSSSGRSHRTTSMPGGLPYAGGRQRQALHAHTPSLGQVPDLEEEEEEEGDEFLGSGDALLSSHGTEDFDTAGLAGGLGLGASAGGHHGGGGGSNHGGSSQHMHHPSHGHQGQRQAAIAKELRPHSSKMKKSGGPPPSTTGKSERELMLLDPKRVKRILANRQSAAKSKERKMAHMQQLENQLAAVQEEQEAVAAHVQDLTADNATLTAFSAELATEIQRLQAHLGKLLETRKVVTSEVSNAQRVLGLPQGLPPDSTAAPDQEEKLMPPLPQLRVPLGAGPPPPTAAMPPFSMAEGGQQQVVGPMESAAGAAAMLPAGRQVTTEAVVGS